MRRLSLITALFACLAIGLRAQPTQLNPPQINFVARFASPPANPSVGSVC